MTTSSTDWFEVIKRVSPDIRLLGIISMDEWIPPRYWARIFILDERDFLPGGLYDYLPRDAIEGYRKELRSVTSWSELYDSYYIDRALDTYFYGNDPDEGSPTMKEAMRELKSSMKYIIGEYKKAL
jgi:hypothetical protein